MNETDLADRIAALEAVFQGRDLAHQQCIHALLMAVEPHKKHAISGLLGALAANARPLLPDPAAPYFDVAVEEAQGALHTS